MELIQFPIEKENAISENLPAMADSQSLANQKPDGTSKQKDGAYHSIDDHAFFYRADTDGYFWDSYPALMVANQPHLHRMRGAIFLFSQPMVPHCFYDT